MEVTNFWSDFDCQHATFSGHSGGYKRVSKKFMPNSPTVVFHSVNIQGTASAAKLAYDLALFVNRRAIIEQAKGGIERQWATRIRASVPAGSSGGVLVSYMVDYRKKKDGMGSTIGSFSHQGIGFLGVGPNALVPYKRVFSEQQMTISSGRAAVEAPKSVDRTMCFLWVFRA